MSTSVLGISELKWTVIGEFNTNDQYNTNDHYVYFFPKGYNDPLEEMAQSSQSTKESEI